MEPFTKWFDTAGHGRVTVLKDTNRDEDDMPCLRIFFSGEGLGTCERTISFGTYERRDTAFDLADMEQAEEWVRMLQPHFSHTPRKGEV